VGIPIFFVTVAERDERGYGHRIGTMSTSDPFEDIHAWSEGCKQESMAFGRGTTFLQHQIFIEFLNGIIWWLSS
jgi:hypothetical protein